MKLDRMVTKLVELYVVLCDSDVSTQPQDLALLEAIRILRELEKVNKRKEIGE